jgi:hypothetical protein
VRAVEMGRESTFVSSSVTSVGSTFSLVLVTAEWEVPQTLLLSRMIRSLLIIDLRFPRKLTERASVVLKILTKLGYSKEWRKDDDEGMIKKEDLWETREQARLENEKKDRLVRDTASRGGMIY